MLDRMALGKQNDVVRRVDVLVKVTNGTIRGMSERKRGKNGAAILDQGEREYIGGRVPAVLFDEIEDARGAVRRNDWLEGSCMLGLDHPGDMQAKLRYLAERNRPEEREHVGGRVPTELFELVELARGASQRKDWLEAAYMVALDRPEEMNAKLRLVAERRYQLRLRRRQQLQAQLAIDDRTEDLSESA